MNTLKVIYILLFSLFYTAAAWGQEKITLTGAVCNALDNSPVENVRISGSRIQKSVMTGEKGVFSLEIPDSHTELLFEAKGFMSRKIYVGERKQLNVYLLPDNMIRHTNKHTTSLGTGNAWDKKGNSFTLNHKDMYQGNSTPDEAIYGMIPGLNVLSKGGMPGEGAFMNMHGVRSLASTNMPLIVIDGVPYLPDENESQVISGYSRNAFAMINQKDIESISLVKGADAFKYGAMGSNGIIMITTEQATDLETKVEFYTVDGIGWMNKRIPMMEAGSFKSYIGDIGETATSDIAQLVDKFPFLKDDPSYHYNYVYDNDTQWQDEIYSKAFTTENVLKVKGGDAIANYVLTVGYQNSKGIIDNTQASRYYARFNANMSITQKLKMFASAGFSYNEDKMMEQGMSPLTNPLLASLHKSPLFSVYEKNEQGVELGTFSKIETYVDGIRNPRTDIIGVSNPAALVNDVEESGDVYNVLINLGLNYQFNRHFSMGALFGLYYNYAREQAFIPGKSSLAIAPLSGGLAQNTVRNAINQANNIYFNGYGSYENTINNIHGIRAVAGYQLITSSKEQDCGSGANTSSDFYKTLNSVTGYINKNIYGYIDNWNWMNIYAKAEYDYKQQMYATVGVSADASSSTGRNADLFRFLPSAQVGIRLANTSLLRDVKAIDQLTVRAEYAQLANSRYSPRYSKYYYGSEMFREVTGLVRENLPNTKLKPEIVHNTTVGIDFATLGRKLNLSLDFYEERTKDMLNKRNVGPIYGFGYVYDNAGELKTQGVDLGIQMTLIHRGGFEWNVGGNISHYKSEIRSLGGENENIISFSDGAALLNRVGETPYQFYGYEAEGVIISRQQSDELNLSSHAGVKFNPGDIRFGNMNGDHRIDEKDLVSLGSATPDFFGGFFTAFRYKGFNLLAQFTYSYGNEIYNGVRRSIESLSGYENQSRIAERRWSYDGQQTDVPRALYGDAIGNSRFSSRWIEDGSYLKLKNVTLGYTFSERIGFFNEIQLYVAGENLFTCTKYIGLDPEFSYSYDRTLSGFDLGKAPLAKTVKLGVKLNF